MCGERVGAGGQRVTVGPRGFSNSVVLYIKGDLSLFKQAHTACPALTHHRHLVTLPTVRIYVAILTSASRMDA